MKKNLDNFITKVPKQQRTSPMTVTATMRGKTIDTFEAPAGFQLDRYVLAHYPKETISVSYKNDSIIVTVTKNGDSQVFLTYTGIYKQK